MYAMDVVELSNSLLNIFEALQQRPHHEPEMVKSPFCIVITGHGEVFSSVPDPNPRGVGGGGQGGGGGQSPQMLLLSWQSAAS